MCHATPFFRVTALEAKSKRGVLEFDARLDKDRAYNLFTEIGIADERLIRIRYEPFENGDCVPPKPEPQRFRGQPWHG